MYAQLLIDLFKYLAPFLRNVELNKPMQILYKVHRRKPYTLPRDTSDISEVDRIAGLEPVIVGHLPACVLDHILLSGVHVLSMLENFSRGFHLEVEGDDIINSIQCMHWYAVKNAQNVRYCCLVKLLGIVICMTPDSLLLLLRSREPEVASAVCRSGPTM